MKALRVGMLAATALLAVVLACSPLMARGGRYTVYRFQHVDAGDRIGPPPTFGRLVRSAENVFMICSVTGIRFEENNDSYPHSTGTLKMVMDINIREMLFGGDPITRNKYTLYASDIYLKQDVANGIRVGDTLAMPFWLSDEPDTSAYYDGGFYPPFAFHVTKRGILIPLATDSLFSPLAGLTLDEARAAVAAAKAGAELPEHIPGNWFEAAMADMVDADGEFTVPGLSWGMGVANFLEADMIGRLDEYYAQADVGVFDDDGRLVAVKLRVHLKHEEENNLDGRIAYCDRVAAEAPKLQARLEEARAAAGFPASLTAKRTRVTISAETDPYAVITPHLILTLRAKLPRG